MIIKKEILKCFLKLHFNSFNLFSIPGNQPDILIPLLMVFTDIFNLYRNVLMKIIQNGTKGKVKIFNLDEKRIENLFFIVGKHYEFIILE